MENYEFIGYHLTNTTEIYDIASDRIYHGEIPETEDTLPAINYFLVSRPNIAFGAGERQRFQISCRAVGSAIAMNLANEVKNAFTEIQDSIGGFDVQNTHYEDMRALSEPDNIYHVPVDIFITYIN